MVEICERVTEYFPRKAVKILRKQYASFQRGFERRDRADLSAALWELAGRSQIPFLVDWFYGEKRAEARCDFLKTVTGWKVVERHLRITNTDGPDIRRLIAALVRDKRFQEIDYLSLQTLVRIVNCWLEEPLISAQSLFDHVSHPLGMMGLYLKRKKALREYPQKTRAVLETLDDWRKRLRASIPRWFPDEEVEQ